MKHFFLKGNELIDVEVMSAGICGTDISKFSGLCSSGDSTVILGHEFVGQIKKGDSKIFVVANPLIACEKCNSCNAGNSNLCRESEALGRTRNGSFSSNVQVPKSNLVPISPGQDYKRFVLADPLAVVLHAIEMSNNRSLNKDVLVIGDGSIGLLLCWLLNKEGKNVYIKSKHSKNLSFAEKMGAKNYAEGQSFGEIYETVGRKQDDTLSMSLVDVEVSGSIVVLGVYDQSYRHSLNARNLFIKEVSMVGSNSFTPNNFLEAVDLISEYKELNQFITHEFDMDDFDNALDTAKNKSGLTIKVILNNRV